MYHKPERDEVEEKHDLIEHLPLVSFYLVSLFFIVVLILV
jgi:hypothetical protein